MNSIIKKAIFGASLLFLCAGASTNAQAQDASEKVYSTADQMPTLLGGKEAAETYFTRALAKVNRKQGGLVTLNLVIGSTGQVEAAEVTDSFVPASERHLEANQALEQAMTKAALTMPGWKPGKVAGKPAAVRVSLPVNITALELPPAEEMIYMYVEQMPGFPGGQPAMEKFIASNINYPKDAITQGQQGMVAVNFIVNTEGIITKSKVIKGISKSIDAEALRIVEAMPTWTPGKQNGRKVSVQMTIPLIFKLPQEEQKK